MAQEQILPHSFIGAQVPQRLKLRIGKENTVFKLFAFINTCDFLYFLEENDNYMMIETYGYGKRTKMLNLELKYDEKGNSISLRETGVAFYHYYPPCLS